MGGLAAAETQQQLSTGSLLLILAPSTLALLGVLFSTFWTARKAEKQERLRAQAGVAAELFAERRRAELHALRLVNDAARALHNFHLSMYGNTGEGADDKKSATAVTEFISKYRRMEALEDCGTELAAYGSEDVANKVFEIVSDMGKYFDGVIERIPKFVAKEATDFEDVLKRDFDELVRLVRGDFGTERAHRVVWGESKQRGSKTTSN